MEAEYNILNIIPANDWVAIYTDGSGISFGREDGVPIVCFALIEYTRDGAVVQEVHPMVSTPNGIEIGTATNLDRVVKV